MLAFPLALFALVSALLVAGQAAVTESNPVGLSKRQAEIGSLPFYYSGLHKRQDSVAPGAKVQLGTSNPAPVAGDINNADVASATSGNEGNITPFSKLARRSHALIKSPASFSPRRRAKRQGESLKVQIGTSNPAPGAGDLNDKGDNNTPTQGTAASGITDFKQRRSFVSPLATPPKVVMGRRSLEPRLPQLHELNLVSHHIATRGFADGRIEPIIVARDSL
ncbi:hypothetical protein BCR35DRAFT_310701 [Leucosporidium creatinivorum]|uniref:Uncharacterized protein n=1 Tax=Leucosporidium creatinivorum TaxID=106004 RepID=A0A1Y2CVZ6_9BASI|nr:hypothetical protein BCR35DRAFT_310701 [Leucosporidium creatinivorum]